MFVVCGLWQQTSIVIYCFHMGSKRKTAVLRLKMEVYYKVSWGEYCQQQSCKASIGLSIRAKMVRGGRTLLRENLAEADRPLQKRRFPIHIC